MTHSVVSARYSFGERVYDATREEHDKALERGVVAVVQACPDDQSITVHHFQSVRIARMFVLTEEASEENTSSHYIVGSDVRE